VNSTFGGVIQDGSTAKTALAVTGETTTLSGINTYSGGTTISGTGAEVAISGSGTLGSTGGTVAINSGGALDLAGSSQTVGALTLGTGNSTIQSTGASGTLNTTSVSVTGTGTIGNTSLAPVTVNSSGTATISGATAQLTLANASALNTATVAVNSGGSLVFGNGGSLVTNALNTTANVTLNNGTLVLNNANQTFSNALTLTGTSGSEINLSGGGALALTMAGTDGGITGISATDQLEIYGWTGTTTGSSTTIISATSLLSLDPTELSNITWQDTTLGGGSPTTYNGATLYNEGGGVYQLVPVPEPSTIFAALSLLGLIGWRSRRQIRQWGFTLL
jgi:hypothetical protein